MIEKIGIQLLTLKHIFLLLLVTVGAELALLGSRFSYFFSDVYNFIMIASIFVAAMMHPIFIDQTKTKRTKKQSIFVFIKCFVIFTTATFIIDIFSKQFLQDFHTNYEEEVIEYTQDYSYFETFNDEIEMSGMEGIGALPFIEWLDTDGYSFFTDILAGFEEVSRVAYIILVLGLMKLLYPNRWEQNDIRFFWILALLFSSLMFGIGHTLSAKQSLNVFIGTVIYYTNFGLILGILLLWTRSLWILIWVHALHNVATTLSWLYYEAAHFIIYLIMLVTMVTIFFLHKYLFIPVSTKLEESQGGNEKNTEYENG